MERRWRARACVSSPTPGMPVSGSQPRAAMLGRASGSATYCTCRRFGKG